MTLDRPIAAPRGGTVGIWFAEEQEAEIRADAVRRWSLTGADDIAVLIQAERWVKAEMRKWAPRGCYAVVWGARVPEHCTGPVVAGRLFCRQHAALGWCDIVCPWSPPVPPPPPAPEPPPPHRWSPSEKQAMLVAHGMGATLRAIAAHHGVTNERIRQLIADAERTAATEWRRVEHRRTERDRQANAPWRMLVEQLTDLRDAGVPPDRVDRAHAALIHAQHMLR